MMTYTVIVKSSKFLPIEYLYKKIRKKTRGCNIVDIELHTTGFYNRAFIVVEESVSNRRFEKY